MSTTTREQFLERQRKTSLAAGVPGNDTFMPKSGICWNCKEDVVAKELAKGNDGMKLVTACLACQRSYCD